MERCLKERQVSKITLKSKWHFIQPSTTKHTFSEVYLFHVHCVKLWQLLVRVVIDIEGESSSHHAVFNKCCGLHECASVVVVVNQEVVDDVLKVGDTFRRETAEESVSLRVQSSWLCSAMTRSSKWQRVQWEKSVRVCAPVCLGSRIPTYLCMNFFPLELLPKGMAGRSSTDVTRWMERGRQ